MAHTYDRYDESTHAGFKKFSLLDGYKLEESHQDIRNLPVYTPAGVKIGQVDDLLVDTENERVAYVTLEDGGMIAVEPLEILDDRVIDHGVGATLASGARPYAGRAVRGV